MIHGQQNIKITSADFDLCFPCLSNLNANLDDCNNDAQSIDIKSRLLNQ
jgi:hypothetical protein